jgi:hypothetical protein
MSNEENNTATECLISTTKNTPISFKDAPGADSKKSSSGITLDYVIDSEQEIQEVATKEEASPKRSLGDRLFSKVEPGSVRGSIFNLSILSLGCGSLALPQKFSQISMLVAVIDIILASIAAYWTLSILVQAADKYKIYNYSKLAFKVHGNWLSNLLDITILFYILGLMILYQVICKFIFQLYYFKFRL